MKGIEFDIFDGDAEIQMQVRVVRVKAVNVNHPVIGTGRDKLAFVIHGNAVDGDHVIREGC